ncbi:MAG: DAK2 domain-containing protein [Chloroflexi bacterium]|nr:MAG: DAK2 domain-containing protein [Chloroflexota bacterium]TMG64416.1 MAG: DAK2 domain-containing protein [Chloroflexota bacterium]
MVAPAKATGVDGQLFKRALLGSLSWLAANHEEVNRLNVFPVPDGDTGTNMLLTLQSAVEDVKESNAAEVSKIAKLASHGSLMGARGNSGVILSQIFRGFARAVEGKSALTPAELAAAFEEAANAAYRAVNKPTEGTILTVAREAGRAAATAASTPDANVPRVIAAAAAGARSAVLKTPSQLQILRDAGVVDAGGFGLQLILEGMLKSVEESEPALAAMAETKRPVSPASQVSLDLPEGGWGYCTEFLIEGNGLDTDLIRGQIESLGNSVLVVGEPELVKVHVHTDDPTGVINLAGGYGKILKLNVGDMSTQHRRILESEGAAGKSRPPRPNGAGLAAVVAGRGLVEIFRGLGVDAIIEGGQTMNPSTQDMLTAIESVPYDEVILLPNNGNVIPAAKQVVGLTKKKVHVVDTHSVPQGVSAVVAFRPERSGLENLKAMKAEAERVQTIEVTHAVRDTRSNGVKVKKGDVIGLINDRLEFAGDDYPDVVKRALGRLGPDSYELVTVYRGEQASDDELARLESEIRSNYPRLEVEVQQGGQQHYPFILSVE